MRERGYRNLSLEREDVAEFEHKPNAARRAYRMVVLRKTIVEERGQRCLGQTYRYFFYITNLREVAVEQVVRESNQRCNQENLIEQLKNSAHALHAPLNTLEANWAYLVIASLAWSLKAWFALLLPVSPRWADKHQADKRNGLRMDLRSFIQRFIVIAAQIVRTGRRIVCRLLAWRLELLIDGSIGRRANDSRVQLRAPRCPLDGRDRGPAASADYHGAGPRAIPSHLIDGGDLGVNGEHAWP